MIALASILFVLLVNSLILLREKHLRRLSAARLEIVKTVTEIEKMMLERKLCAGNLCHDKFHQRMLAVQYGGHFGINWGAFFSKTRSPEWEKVRAEIHKEIDKKTELGKLLRHYLWAAFKAYSNERPFSTMVFWAWVIICYGGMIMLFTCFVAYIRSVEIYKKKRTEFMSYALELYGALRMQKIGG